MIDLKGKINVGDTLYSLAYFNSAFKRSERSITTRKIKKLNPLSVTLFDGLHISYNAINNEYVDEYFTTKDLMYKSKLRYHKKEYGDILNEIIYLEKKVGKLK